jgi:putative tryptophan/tyrosine transport system substrate-binding protein
MRRVILGLFIALTAVPLEAAEATKVVGVLFGSTSRDVPWIQSFLDELRDQGYVEGRNMRIEFRSAEGNVERLPSLAAELVALKPDVILSSSVATTRPLKELTRTIPIVMAQAQDPIKWGLIESLAHPGGNITGLTDVDAAGLLLKQMQMLKELVPGATEIVFVWNPLVAYKVEDFKEAQRAAPAMGVKILSLPVRDLEELRNSLDAMDAPINDGTRAMLVDTDHVAFRNRNLIIDFASRHRLPTMYTYREEVADGGLIAYSGLDLVTHLRRAATYVGKILKGAKPADLPVEQPTTFHLCVNLKTAKALDLAIPPSILIMADEVIE